MDVVNGTDDVDEDPAVMDEWEVVKKPSSGFGVKREYCIITLALGILKGKMIYKKAKNIYKFASSGATLGSRLYCVNFTMSPWCPPKLSLPLSLALICLFMYNQASQGSHSS